MPKSITIQLTENKFDRAKDNDSLGELLQEVADIIHPNDDEMESRAKARTKRWVAAWAIRAMCEEVIRTGQFWSPPEVSFTNFWCKKAKGVRFQASRN